MIVRPNPNLIEYELSPIEEEISTLEKTFDENNYPLKTEMIKQHEQGLKIIKDLRDITANEKLLDRYKNMSPVYFSGSILKFFSEAKTIIEETYKS